MDTEIQLISDGDGIAVIGEASAVQRFLDEGALPSRALDLSRLGAALGSASAVAQAGSQIAAQSGRWVKLTEKSAAALKSNPQLMKGSQAGTFRGVLTRNGKASGLLEFTKGPGSLLTNPAMLAGAAGIMAQLAMQQTMDEITDYLAAIDEKVDDILRGQKDAVLADMIGVGFVIDETMTIRDHVGRVSEVSWSKVQGAAATIGRTQAYAVRQLEALADKLETKAKVSDLAAASKQAESTIQEWLAVLARCFQLQEALGVLELDRVLDAAPDDLEQHRLALRTARQKRLEVIAAATEQLVERVGAAAGTANSKVLLHPTSAHEVVRASNHVSSVVVDFHRLLGLEHSSQSLEARRWLDAATEVRDKALDAATEVKDKALDAATEAKGLAFVTGAEGVDSAKRLGSETLGRARWMTGKLSTELAERTRRMRGENPEPDA